MSIGRAQRILDVVREAAHQAHAAFGHTLEFCAALLCFVARILFPLQQPLSLFVDALSF